MTDGLDGERVVREQAVDRAAELAESHREAGWDALALQPANVVPIPVGPDTGEDRPADADVGISFLLPPQEFALLADLLESDPDSEVVRGGRGEHAAVVVTLSNESTGGALVIPLWFHEPTAGAMARAARDRGQLDLLVRLPDADRQLRVPLNPDAVLDEA